MTIEDFEVFLIRPDFGNDPKLSVKGEFKLTALSAAPRIASYVGDWPLHAFRHEYVLRGRIEIDSFLDFWFARSGRWQNFWVPSWHPELSPKASVPAGSQSLIIKGIDYANLYLASDDVTRLGHYIWMLSDTGTFFITKVLAADGGDLQSLTLETAAPVQFTLGRFMVGYLYFVRFVDDILNVKFSGINDAMASLSMVETLAPTAAD